MRSGTRTMLKRRWTPLGHRPPSPVKIGYEYVYLYAAVNPYTGHLLALLLPRMNKECFTIFMDYFAEQTGTLYGSEAVLLIADGASNHQAEVIQGSTILLQKLPAACPELNPAERFFQALRLELSNQVFEEYEQVIEKIEEILQKYFNNPELVRSLTHFPYIRLP